MTSRSQRAPARTHRPFVLVAFLSLAILPAAAETARAESCSLPIGQHVTLQSDAVDPDVFLWDSRARLIAYVAGGWDSTREVMDHTLLANPGTDARVIACAPGAARPRYSADTVDAVGVKIVRGAYRGRFGWIVSTDARAVTAPATTHAAR